MLLSHKTFNGSHTTRIWQRSPYRQYTKTSLQVLRSRIEARVRALRAKADANLTTAQQRYKIECKRQVRAFTTFHPGDRVFFNRTAFSSTFDTDATQSTLNVYDKQMSRIVGPFCVKEVRTHSVVIDKHQIENVVSTHRTTQVLHAE